jgi:methionyl-tRNA synthetase
MKSFYITTTLPYVNADPHIGFASEIVIADVIARHHRNLGEEVFFNTGTDEHGQKIYQNALESEQTPQEYVDYYVKQFKKLKNLLDLSYTNLVRTTDEHHMESAQELWRRVEKNGYIYKKDYSVKYCVGCELEKTDSELEDGKCSLHPNREIEYIEEENYFFRFSAFGEKLLKLYEKYPDFVIPEKRFNEIKAFVERGLEDFSISRRKEKMPWGVPVPGDEEHVMYVWFDALTNYISTLGWPQDKENFEKFWGKKENPQAVQIAGKDNLRQQSAMWQAMLLASDLPPSRRIGINGFISVNGQKMSKSLGNVIAPSEMVEKFGTNGARYLLLSLGRFGEDKDITWEWLIEKYNADLANGLGNLASRVITLAPPSLRGVERIGATKQSSFPLRHCEEESSTTWQSRENSYEIAMSLHQNVTPRNDENDGITTIDHDIENFMVATALEKIWDRIAQANKYIEENKPWELKKTDPEKFEKVMKHLLGELSIVSQALTPFLPETSQKIVRMLETGEKESLFQRIQ